MLVMDVNEWTITNKQADDGSSQKDARATSFRLRVLRQTEILTPAHDPVINECAELVKIVAALIRNSTPM